MANSAKGGARSFTFTFKLDGTLTNPNAISFQVSYPDGTTASATEAEMEYVSTGVYRYTLSPLTHTGIHTWKVTGTWSGVTQATLDKTFVVDESLF